MLEFGGEESPASMARLYYDIRRFVHPLKHRAFLLWMLRHYFDANVQLRIIGHLARACKETHWGTWLTPQGRIGVSAEDALLRGNEEVHAEVRRVLQSRLCADAKLHIVFSCGSGTLFYDTTIQDELLQYWTTTAGFPNQSVMMEWEAG